MQCLKCGKDVSSGPTFCGDCLSQMERFPVAPGTPVYIPKREAPDRRAPAQHTPSTREQLSRLRRRMQRMYVLVALLTLLLCAAVIALIRNFDQPPAAPQGPVVGQNYTTNLQP